MSETNATDHGHRQERPTHGPCDSHLEAARRSLLDTGTRNRLIHVNRNNPRANCINIVNERSDDVFRILRRDGRRMKFKAMGEDREEPDDDTRLAPIDARDGETDEDRYTDAYLETRLGPDAQQKRLLRLALDARTAEEEQGVNILYLALGFVTWFEDNSSSVAREAPLILLPAELVRNARTSTYDLRCRDDEITTNLPLQERLKQDFGMVLPEIDEGDDWLPSEYFSRVTDLIAERTGWCVQPDAMQLGFFSFAKFLMVRDLELHSRKANKKVLAAELGRTLRAGAQRAPAAPAAPDELRNTRDMLNWATDVLHTPLHGVEYTPFAALADLVRCTGLDVPAPWSASPSIAWPPSRRTNWRTVCTPHSTPRGLLPVTVVPWRSHGQFVAG